MKTTLIEAFDKDGNKLGEREVDQPETMEELQDQFEEKDIIKLAWRSFVIDVQRELRAEAVNGRTSNQLAKKVKQLTPEQQKQLEEYMASLGVK
jgi:hypothetical protein